MTTIKEKVSLTIPKLHTDCTRTSIGSFHLPPQRELDRFLQNSRGTFSQVQKPLALVNTLKKVQTKKLVIKPRPKKVICGKYPVSPRSLIRSIQLDTFHAKCGYFICLRQVETLMLQAVNPRSIVSVGSTHVSFKILWKSDTSYKEASVSTIRTQLWTFASTSHSLKHQKYQCSTALLAPMMFTL